MGHWRSCGCNAIPQNFGKRVADGRQLGSERDPGSQGTPAVAPGGRGSARAEPIVVELMAPDGARQTFHGYQFVRAGPALAVIKATLGS